MKLTVENVIESFTKEHALAFLTGRAQQGVRLIRNGNSDEAVQKAAAQNWDLKRFEEYIFFASVVQRYSQSDFVSGFGRHTILCCCRNESFSLKLC